MALSKDFGPWHSFADYRSALDSAQLPEALDEMDRAAGEDRGSVQRTFELSLTALASAGIPQARPLLMLLSCYAPVTPIPVNLLQAKLLSAVLTTATAGSDAGAGSIADVGAADKVPVGPPGDDGAKLERSRRVGLEGLADQDLISVIRDDDAGAWAVAVNPVVVDVNRSRLRAAATKESQAIGGTAVRLLQLATVRLGADDPADLPAWRQLAPHIVTLEWLAPLLAGDALVDLLDVSVRAARALWNGWGLAGAESLAKSGAAEGVRLGAEHPSTLAVRHLLAAITGRQGRDAEAERLFRQVLADERRVLGDEARETLETRHELAVAIEYQGRHSEAEKIYRDLLDDQTEVLGPHDRDTLATLHRLAFTVGFQGRYADAETLFRQELAVRERFQDKDSAGIVAARHGVAWTMAWQGRWADAERLFGQVLASRRRIRGDHHPQTLATLYRIGWVTAGQGRHAEAERLLGEVLADQCRVLGNGHQATLRTRYRLALAIDGQGRHAEAERLLGEVLADRRRVLGNGHQATLRTRYRLALAINGQGRHAEAERLLGEVLAVQRRVLGNEHRDTLDTRRCLEECGRGGSQTGT